MLYLEVKDVKGTQEKTATDHLSQKCFIAPNHDLSTKYPETLSLVYNSITIARKNLAKNNTESEPSLFRSSIAVRTIGENKQLAGKTAESYLLKAATTKRKGLIEAIGTSRWSSYS